METSGRLPRPWVPSAPVALAVTDGHRAYKALVPSASGLFAVKLAPTDWVLLDGLVSSRRASRSDVVREAIRELAAASDVPPNESRPGVEPDRDFTSRTPGDDAVAQSYAVD